MKHWRTTTLGEICSFRSGIGFSLELQGAGEGDYPFIKVSDMNLTANAVFIKAANNWINEGVRESLKAEPIPEGTTVFAKIGEALKQNRVRMVVRDTFIDNNMMGALPRLKEVTPVFLFYLLSNFDIASTATGAALPFLRVKDLAASKVSVPALELQRYIGDTLSAYDDLMENNRRRMALLEESARLLYREWFVHLRFPGHEHTRLINGVPQGWLKATLGSITTKIGSGATPRGGDAAYQSEGLTLIRSLNVYDDRFDDDGLAFISDEQAAALANVSVEPKDILLNITGASVCRCCMAPERYLPARVNQHVMIIRADPAKADPFLVHAAINSDERKRQLLSYAQKGSTREALTKETVSNFEITLPTDDLMRRYGEIAADAFRQRELLTQQTQKLRTARDLLLPRLMSGEIEV